MLSGLHVTPTSENFDYKKFAAGSKENSHKDRVCKW